ncbi:porin [Paracoccus sp. (in: a-proteobacteria)]|uniref:porin n=1 Tax=Paracoccus sp. TaxID=267 RepID=UPI003A84981C
MKKVLFATTALALSAGIAAADVTVSGYGRSGLLYVEDRADAPMTYKYGYSTDGEANDLLISSRLRINLDASTTTDVGIDFGGRLRLQWDQGDNQTTVAPGYVYMSVNGFRMEAGNANTAYDSSGLISASEIGIFGRSFGDSRGSYYSYNTDGYPSASNFDGSELLNDYLGIFGSYTMDNLTVRASIVNPDQQYQNDLKSLKKEIGVSADYKWNDRLEVGAGYVTNAKGMDGNDQWYIGARYAVVDNARIGLNYLDNGETGAYRDTGTDYVWEQTDWDNTVVLYGDYTMDRLNLAGYIANNGYEGNDTDNAFGVGAKYDLGGAYVAASVQRGYDKNYTADMGVRFDF